MSNWLQTLRSLVTGRNIRRRPYRLHDLNRFRPMLHGFEQRITPSLTGSASFSGGTLMISYNAGDVLNIDFSTSDPLAPPVFVSFSANSIDANGSVVNHLNFQTINTNLSTSVNIQGSSGDDIFTVDATATAAGTYTLQLDVNGTPSTYSGSL